MNFKFQSVTNDNYLKIHDFKIIQYTNQLMKKINSMTINIIFKIDKDIDEEIIISSTIRIYEDLNVKRT